MKHEETGGNTGSVLFAFLLGGIVGAGLAFLLAPQSGHEMRQRLSGLAEDAKGRAEDYAHHARDRVDSTVKKGRDYVGEKKTIISTAVEAGKEAYEKEKGKHAQQEG